MTLTKLNLLVIILLLGISKPSNFPLEVSEIQTPNTIVNYKGQKLILVDFWATWCGPCRIAGKQLEYLQEQLKDELFIISVTDETHEVVEKFLKKHPTQLMIVRDIAGNIFRQYEVNSRPYAILFTAEGELLWRGHPSGLTYKKIKRFHRSSNRVKGHKKVEDFLLVEKVEKVSYDEEASNLEFFVEKTNEPNAMVLKNKYYVDYYGPFTDLVADVNRVPKHFVTTKRYNDFRVHLRTPTEVWDNSPSTIMDLLQQTFDINIVSTPSEEKVVYLTVEDESKLWDTEQIDWGDDVFYHYLIGEDRIKADNLSIADFCLLLSNVKNKTYKYSGTNTDLHDWDIHFRFNNLMETELLDEYGIKLEKNREKVNYFYIE